MYPFYVFAYRGRNIQTAMNFKKRVYGFTDREYVDFYSNLNSISRNRKTDINEATIKYVLDNLDKNGGSLLDVGCGSGYFLNRLAKQNKQIELAGCDIVENKNSGATYKYVKADIKQLPFNENQFDIVTCFHTLEHIVHPEKAVGELKRVARRQVVICVPCQRYYFYTLDEHVNFWFYDDKLIEDIKLKKYLCKKLSGDYLYIGWIE
jgi:ubiquinone/menaquinone biosynthesis C-methylase UbiE